MIISHSSQFISHHWWNIQSITTNSDQSILAICDKTGSPIKKIKQSLTSPIYHKSIISIITTVIIIKIMTSVGIHESSSMVSSSSSNFISNKYIKTSIYNTIALMNNRNVHMYPVGGYQKKPRLIELAISRAGYQLSIPDQSNLIYDHHQWSWINHPHHQ